MRARGHHDLPRAQRWAQFLLASFPPACATVRSLLLRTLNELATEIDTRKEEWTAGDHLRAPALHGPSVRVRNADGNVRGLALQEVHPSDQQRYWQHKHLVSLMNAGAKSAASELHFSICFDAGRIGKPALDVNLCLCYLHGSRSVIALPPMVP